MRGSRSPLVFGARRPAGLLLAASRLAALLLHVQVRPRGENEAFERQDRPQRSSVLVFFFFLRSREALASGSGASEKLNAALEKKCKR